MKKTIALVSTLALMASMVPTIAGAETGNGGRDLPAIDTSAAGSHTIIYTATDSAGNIGTATRTVNVIDSTTSTATSTPQ